MMMLKPRPRPPARTDAPAALAMPERTLHAVPAALQQVSDLSTLCGQAFARSAGNGIATAALLPLALQPETGAELAELQLAVMGRVQQMQRDWWQSWSAWAEEFSQLRRATTMSEHLEQQYNIAEQFMALLKDQAGDLMDLQENVQVDYGYWVAQKFE